MIVMKHKLTEEERRIIKERAFRLYKAASQRVIDNPLNYDKELVFKLMRQEQELLTKLK